MKKDSRDVSGYSIRSKSYRFADSVEGAMSAFRNSGNRMKKMCKVPSSIRVRNLRAWSVAKEFRPRGSLYKCFLACCGALGSAHACEKRLLDAFKRKLDWFCDSLTEYLGYGHADAVAKFSTLFESMVDIAEEDRPCEIRTERNRLSRMGEKVFYDLSIQVKEREVQLRVPVKPTSLIEGSPKAPPGRDDVKRKLRMLVRRVMADCKDVRTINDAVGLIRFAKPGVPYFADAEEVNKEIKFYRWSEETIRQYAKDIGKHRKSRRGARIQAARRRKRRLVERDTLDYRPPK